MQKSVRFALVPSFALREATAWFVRSSTGRQRATPTSLDAASRSQFSVVRGLVAATPCSIAPTFALAGISQ